MDKLKDNIARLKELGFSKDQTIELLEIGKKDILDKALSEIQEPNKVKEYMDKVKKAQGDRDKLDIVLDDILENAYTNENSEEKKTQLLTQYLQEIIDLTEETRMLFQKYSKGDQETIDAVQEAQKNPQIKEIAKKMIDDGK